MNRKNITLIVIIVVIAVLFIVSIYVRTSQQNTVKDATPEMHDLEALQEKTYDYLNRTKKKRPTYLPPVGAVIPVQPAALDR